jgi:hypothetical protein
MRTGSSLTYKRGLGLVVLAFALLLSSSATAAGLAGASGSISGTLNDFDTGFGIAGAQVRIYGVSGFERATVTDAGGAYSFTGLPTVSGTKTRYTIVVAGAPGTDSQFYSWDNGGYVPAYGGARLGNLTSIGLSGGQSITSADLTGTRWGAVAGTLSFEDEPVPMGWYAVRITSVSDPAASYSAPFEWGEPYSLPVPTGAYRVTFSNGIGFPLDRFYSVVSDGVRAESLFETASPLPATVATGVVSTVNSSLAYNRNSARISGRVLGPDGQPLDRAQVAAYCLTPDQRWRPVAEALLDSDSDGFVDSMALSSQATTREDGTFVLQLLGGASYRIGVSPDQYGVLDVPLNAKAAVQYFPDAAEVGNGETLSLAKGQNSAVGEWTLGYGATLTGSLVDPLGHGLMSAWGYSTTVFAQRLSDVTGEWEAVSGSYGESTKYALGHLPAGTYRVWFRGLSLGDFYYGQKSGSGAATTITVPAVSQPTTITLKPSVFPGKVYPTLSVTPFWPTVRRYSTVRLTASVKTGNLLVKGASLKIYRSYNWGRTWTYVKTVKTSTSTGKYVYTIKPSRSVQYRFRYLGTSKIRAADSRSIVEVR